MIDIFGEIKKAKSILLLTHEKPDGDAIGSIMALYYLINGLNISVDVVIPEVPATFNYLTDIDKVKTESSLNYDLTIVVDCSNKERIGQLTDEFSRCKKSIIIDHHISNTKYGDINYVESETASCCQILYYLFKKWNISITKEIGEALITGSLTDTSGFRNNNIDKFTFLMAAELTDIVDVPKIYYQAISKKSMAQYMLMKMTIDRIELFADGKIAFSYISNEDMENVGALPGDHEGLVDIGRYIDGVEVSIFMREEDGYRVSFRSNGLVDVNIIANSFGGGGHLMAAGAKLDGSFKEVKDKLIERTIEEFND